MTTSIDSKRSIPIALLAAGGEVTLPLFGYPPRPGGTQWTAQSSAPDIASVALTPPPEKGPIQNTWTLKVKAARPGQARITVREERTMTSPGEVLHELAMDVSVYVL